MKPSLLLDTNILIYLRRRKSQHILTRFGERPVGDAVMSVVTYGELSFGVAKNGGNRARAAMEELVRAVPVLPLTQAVAEAYGELRASLAARGSIIGNNDLWIAAHALAEDLTLVTNNMREFQRVHGLRTENWVKQSA